MRTVKGVRRRSQRQERELAADLGGRQQKASGALSGAKGDVRQRGRFRAECKFTKAASYTLKRSELNKIHGECLYPETPAFDITFTDQYGRTEDRWVAIPYSEFVKLYAPEDDC